MFLFWQVNLGIIDPALQNYRWILSILDLRLTTCHWILCILDHFQDPHKNCGKITILHKKTLQDFEHLKLCTSDPAFLRSPEGVSKIGTHPIFELSLKHGCDAWTRRTFSVWLHLPYVALEARDHCWPDLAGGIQRFPKRKIMPCSFYSANE